MCVHCKVLYLPWKSWLFKWSGRLLGDNSCIWAMAAVPQAVFAHFHWVLHCLPYLGGRYGVVLYISANADWTWTVSVHSCYLVCYCWGGHRNESTESSRGVAVARAFETEVCFSVSCCWAVEEEILRRISTVLFCFPDLLWEEESWRKAVYCLR